MIRLYFENLLQNLLILSFNYYDLLLFSPANLFEYAIELVVKLNPVLVGVDKQYFPLIC